MNAEKLHDDLKLLFCVYEYRKDFPPIIQEDLKTLHDKAINRFRNDVYFHQKVSIIVQRVMDIIEDNFK